MKKIFIHFLKNTHIGILTLIPTILALIVIVGWFYLANRYFPNANDQVYGLIFILAVGIFSLGGFAQIYRREAHGVPTHFGFWPIISGLIWVLACFIGIILLVIVFF